MKRILPVALTAARAPITSIPVPGSGERNTVIVKGGG